MNPAIVFTLLFFLSVIKPFTLPNSNRYMGGFLFLVVVILFLYSLVKQANYRQIYQNYPYEINFLALYLGISLVSLITHIDQFEQLSHFIFFTLASFAVYLSSFMLWIIFSYLGRKQQNTVLNPLWIVLFLMALVALWQYLDYPGSRLITDYFVSADTNQGKIPIISSITRWHTVFGVIAAIAILVLLQGLLNLPSKSTAITLILFILFLLFIGIIGESRNFLFSLGIGLMIMLGSGIKQFPKTAITLFVSAFVLVHFMLISNTSALNDYAKILPYLKKIEQKQVPQINDFIPQINNNTLTDRVTLWKQGLEMWKKEPWLGIGPGMYRTVNADDVQQRNLHNYYFQVLVETGVLGFIAMMGLLNQLIKRAIKANNLPVFGAVLASLLFDNYLDYSFPWVIMMVWLLSISILMDKTGKKS